MTALLLVSACRYGYDPVFEVDDGGAGGEADAADGLAADAAPADAAPADAAPAAPDAATLADAAPPDPACDPTAPLADDFGGATPDPRWARSSSFGALAANVSGRLRIALPAVTESGTYASYVTLGRYDATGRRVSVEVPTMVDTATHAQAVFQLLGGTTGATYAIAFEQQHGVLNMTVSGPGTPERRSIPYDPTLHRYWQLREAAGVVYFDTSADGAGWTNRFASSAGLDVRQVRVQLMAGTYQAETSPGLAEFDHLAGTLPLGTSCKR